MTIGIDDVLAGLIANAVTSVVAKLGHVVREDLTAGDDDTSLAPILKEATDEIAESLQWSDAGRLEEVCLFLSTPEAEQTLREVFAASLSAADQPETLSSARTNFIRSLAWYMDVDQSEVTSEAGRLFDQLASSCQNVLSAAIDKGILSAHEAKSAYRNRIIVDGLAAIEKRLKLISSVPKSTRGEILEFEEKYSQPPPA